MAASRVILNLGGEGEIREAINLNNLAGLLRPVSEITARGVLIVHDILDPWPFADASIDEVVGNCLPGFSAQERLFLLAEALRVLKADGCAKVHSHSVTPPMWLRSMERAGFVNLRLEAAYGFGHAVGAKPRGST